MVKKLKVLPVWSGARQGYPLSPLLFHMVLEVPSQSIKKQKRNKTCKTWKISKTVFVCRWHTYNTILKKNLWKMLQLVKKFIKMQDTKLTYKNK